MTDQELKDLVASLAIQSAKNTEEIKAQSAKIDTLMARTDAQMEDTDVEIAKLAKKYGNDNQGNVAEKFFFNALAGTPMLNNIKYYRVQSLHVNKGNVEYKYDILMTNSEDIFIIEVKYKAHKSDLEQLLNKKYPNFKKLFPEYKNYQHHLGLASFHINDELKKQALAQGVSILQRKGKVIETIAA